MLAPYTKKMVEKKVLSINMYILHIHTRKNCRDQKKLQEGQKRFERETMFRVEWPNSQYCVVLFLLY